MSRPAEVVIDLSALRHNFNYIRSLVSPARIMAIVKADAYGHGISSIAPALDQADAFGVACLEEAKQLRQMGIRQRINILEGPYSAEELTEMSELAMDIVIHDISQLEMLEQAQLSKPLSVWLKLDTGMHRLGFMPELAHSVLVRLQQMSCVKNIHLMTHLACANDPSNPINLEQMNCFSRFSKDLDLQKTIANSAAIIAFPETYADWVRPGIMLYGVSPFAGSSGLQEELQPVMTLKSKLITVKQLKAGQTVGYGSAWQCPEDMPVGVIAAGYGDGYPRHARSGTPVLVNAQRVQLIGHASMDMLTVDLRLQPQAKIGDPAILWGKGLPVEEISSCAGTIPYEILSTVHKRLKVCYGEA